MTNFCACLRRLRSGHGSAVRSWKAHPPILLLALTLMTLLWASCAGEEGVTPQPVTATDVPLVPGTVWTYSYSYSFTHRGIDNTHKNGMRVWHLLSIDSAKTPPLMTFASHSVDTVHQYHNAGGVITSDTTFVTLADTSFKGECATDSVRIGWTSTIPTNIPGIEAVPRTFPTATDTLRFKGIFSGAVSYEAVYVKRLGLVSSRKGA